LNTRGRSSEHLGVAAIEIDESRFPIVVVTFTGNATDAEFSDYLASMTAMMVRRGTHNVTILDARKSGVTPPKQRKMQGEWLKANKERLERQSLGSAFVIDSPLVRGVLTAILWIAPMPQAHIVVSTIEEAEAWAHRRVREATPAKSSAR
jgi:hypothetical protein